MSSFDIKKWKMEFLGKYKKMLDTKRARILKQNREHIFIKNTTVHKSKSKLCTGLFNI